MDSLDPESKTQHLGHQDLLTETPPEGLLFDSDGDTSGEDLTENLDSSASESDVMADSDQSMTIVVSPDGPRGPSSPDFDDLSPDSLAMESEAAESRCGFIDGYSILGSLGHGGMGIVYQAIQERLQRVVALKVLRPRTSSPEFVKRFQREAMAVARLNHPNIVTAYDFGESEGQFYLAIEYVEGMDCSELMMEKTRLKESEALSIVRDAVLGLSHALAQGIIHRDVKPANLMLSASAQRDASGGALSGLVKVTDLGLAQIRENAGALRQDRSNSGEPIVGTPAYMAPEHARGEHLDFRADIYSLGATFYYFLTGKKPHLGGDACDILERKLKVNLEHAQDLAPDTSDGTALVIDRMMARDPDYRYQSYEELLIDLQRLMMGEHPETSAVPDQFTMMNPRRSKRSFLKRRSRNQPTPMPFRLRMMKGDNVSHPYMTWAKYLAAIAIGAALMWLVT